jgi:hypothetical protein
MNKRIAQVGAAVVTVTVFLFAVCLIADFTFGSYFVCMLLPVGYILLAAGLQHESPPERRVAANAGLALAAVYAVLILLVYFAQTTTVRTASLNDQASRTLNFGRGGLIFNYDLLGYGMMALSTFFTGLAMKAENRTDRWLKRLLMIHGIFFPGCFFMPMTSMFTSMAKGGGGNDGNIALLFWCLYFFPVGLLAWKHFREQQ